MRMAELAQSAEIIRGIGDNNPPEPTRIEAAQEAVTAMSEFLDATPVIMEGAHLVDAKRLVERARGAIAELETERTALVKPLNDEVASINASYKALHNADPRKPGTLDRVLTEIKARLTAYAREEELRRAQEADAARAAAEQAEAATRAAERIEQQAKEDAVVGVIDTGVGEAIANADRAFAEFQKASRFATRAERDATFRIGDGPTKALGMRSEKTLVLESYSKAITAIGKNEKIETAILSAARDYRKLHNKLPDGVIETTERKF